MAPTAPAPARILRAHRDGSSDSLTFTGSQQGAQVQVPGTQEPEGLQQAPDVRQANLPDRPQKCTRKEERDDELHALELEAKRAAIEHDNEIRRRALQQQEELHQLKLAQFNTEYTSNPNDQDDEGEIPPEAKAVSLLFPSAPQKEVAAIFNNKFDPTNLYKLCRKIGLPSDADAKIYPLLGGSSALGREQAQLRTILPQQPGRKPSSHTYASSLNTTNTKVSQHP